MKELITKENKKVTQKDIINQFQNILNKYNFGDLINEDDFKITMELFLRHPNWKIKKGCGIKYIKVDNIFGYKVFTLHRIDGSTTDISFYVTARGKPTTTIQRIKNACRYSIRETIRDFRKTINFGKDRCEITNEILYNDTNTHIDHYDLTFNDMFNLWINNKDIAVLETKLNDGTIDNVVNDFFLDDVLVSEFISFHNNNTKLRAVKKIANLSLLRKQKGVKKNENK